MSNESRENFNLLFFCSKHPKTALQLNHGDSKIGASSAYEMHINVMIEPCNACLYEYELLKQSIDIVIKNVPRP